MQKRRNAFLVAMLLCVAAIVCTFMYINKGHENAGNFIADESIHAEAMYKDYASNESHADSIYLNKIIEVTGKLKAKLVENNNYFLLLQANEQGNINCRMMMSDTTLLNALSINKTIIIKGRCTGFLMDVNLVDCVLSK